MQKNCETKLGQGKVDEEMIVGKLLRLQDDEWLLRGFLGRDGAPAGEWVCAGNREADVLAAELEETKAA